MIPSLLVLALLMPPAPDRAVADLGAPTYRARELATARLAIGCRADRCYRDLALAGRDHRDPEVALRCRIAIRRSWPDLGHYADNADWHRLGCHCR